MAGEMATANGQTAAIEAALVTGDLARLTSEQRVSYYHRVCESLGLNPYTQPFNYVNLGGKLVLYARKDCTEQLRKSQGVTLRIVSREVLDGVYVVSAEAKLPNGRTDESIGAVAIEGLKGEAKANALMKAETKAKRRVTLSICGLGMVDESEIDSIPGARVVETQVAPQALPAAGANGQAAAGPTPPPGPLHHSADMAELIHRKGKAWGWARSRAKELNGGTPFRDDAKWATLPLAIRERLVAETEALPDYAPEPDLAALMERKAVPPGDACAWLNREFEADRDELPPADQLQPAERQALAEYLAGLPDAQAVGS